VQVPGVDAIWNQVWPGRVAEFVRLPASAAHLHGRPRALSESYAAYRDFPITVETARWGVNYQVVRGINFFEFMFFPSSAGRGDGPRRGYMSEPGFAEMVAYTNRLSWLLGQGRPVAQVGLYFPTASMWLGDAEPDARVMDLAARLGEVQRDFDFVDDHALSSVLRLDGNRLRNASGAGYRTMIVPSERSCRVPRWRNWRRLRKRAGT
jgi:hypothetical protein